MNEVMKFIKDNKKIIIVIIVVIVAFFVIRNYLPQIKLYFQPKNIDLQPGESVEISETRKRYLESLAGRVYADIYSTSTFTGHDDSVYIEANAVTDNELLYMAGYYKKYLSSGVSMWQDIDDEAYLIQSPTDLQQHLSKIGER